MANRTFQFHEQCIVMDKSFLFARYGKGYSGGGSSRGNEAGVKHLHPHRFRSSFVTRALDAGVALHEVQAAVGHSSPDITQRYDRGVRGRGVTLALAKFRKQA